MNVRFFAHLQNVTGCPELALQTRDEITAEELWEMLEKKFPGILRYKNSTRLARNFVYATRDENFRADDEVALIPPVSGG